MSRKMFETTPEIIAALHLPEFALNRHRSVAWYEDYALANAGVFAEAGVPWIKLQDQTRTSGPASTETLALMASLGRLIRAEYPDLGLGIIIEAHDPEAALSVAHATGASFVLAVGVNPGGATVIASKWLIHTSCSSGRSAGNSDESAVRVSRARPYSPAMPRPTVPPSWVAISWAP